jgi:hypothetical protein
MAFLKSLDPERKVVSVSAVRDWAEHATKEDLAGLAEFDSKCIRIGTLGPNDLLYTPAGAIVFHCVMNGQDVIGIRIGVLGAPSEAAGGTLLGVGSITLLSPRSSAVTLPVNWTPAAPGSYTLYAVIDPNGSVSESDENNNLFSRTVTVLAQAADQTAPRVDSFTINQGAPSADDRRVRLDAQASDPAPSSGLQSLLYQEFEFSQAANQWVPVRNSGWLDYATARADFGWDLVDSPGIKYLQAWAADRSGNISAFPFRAGINYVPPQDRVGRNMARSYRYALEAGQRLVVTVTPISGDPDLYVWPPDSAAPPYVSNLSGAAVDTVTFTAAETGDYQVEVYGYSEAEYRLTIVVDPAAAAAVAATLDNTAAASAYSSNASETGPSANLEKVALTDPVLSRESAPTEQQTLPAAPALPDAPPSLYLPMVTR